MKVLKNNFDNGRVAAYETIVVPRYPRKLECEECGSELEYDESDLQRGVYGAMHIQCPLCGYNNMLDGNENDIKLTKDNILFPVDFHHTSTECGAVDTCKNDFVRECIQKAIHYFRTNKKEFAYYTGTGNTMIYVFRLDGDEEYEVVVANDYYETYIPFEEEDY